MTHVTQHAENARAAAGALAGASWADQHPAVLGEVIDDLMAARNQLDAALVQAARAFETAREHQALGYRSVGAYLQHRHHLPRHHAERLARLGRVIGRFPHFEAALEAGTITLDHLDTLARAHTEADHAAWAEAEPLLARAAAEGQHRDFAHHVTSFADQLHPRDADDRFDRQLADRALHKATTLHGAGWLEAALDPFSYEVVSAELDRIERRLFREEWAALEEQLGRTPTTADLTRTPAQRRHDALVEMAHRSRTLTGRHLTSRPCVTIHTDLATLTAAAARRLRLPGVDDPEPGTGLCELDDGTPIAPAAALHASFVGELRRIVFDDDHDEILHYGRSRRLYSDPQADATRAKYRRCCFLGGCSSTHTETDHVVEWQDGGTTDITNARRVDDHHNRWKRRTRQDPPHHDRPDSTQQRLTLHQAWRK